MEEVEDIATDLTFNDLERYLKLDPHGRKS